MVGRSVPSVLACLLALACGDSPPASESDTSHAGSDEIASTSSESESETGDESSADASGSDDASTGSEGPSFDLAPSPDLAEQAGCDAIDFLFVIDDSSSMAEHQQNLVANVPAFVAGIEATLDSVDSYQVGVIATDAYPYNPPVCILLGALVTSTEDGGPDSSDMICGPYAEGFNYMTQADELGESFACAAQVGTLGNGFERPMEAMVETLGQSLDVPGGCNEGFLRDDALLVIVVITDEWDGPGDPEALNPARDPPTSAGTPQTWYDAVVAAKAGIPQNAAALVITNYHDGPCPPADLGHDGANLVEWVEHFGDNGVLGGICEPDYGPMFADATAVIETACANFVPVG
ncbi:hypothetical protein ACNOYE_25550 [Nannocystaceae bacterium ST9]